jgi:hypothetical protein
MKRALIAIASVGILAPAAWVVGANAQYGAPAPAYSQPPAYNPSQTYPPRTYSRRTYRRSARRGTRYTGQTPYTGQAPYTGSVTYTPGSGPPPYDVQRSAQANQPFEWHGAPGPNRRGNMCVTHTDPLRGYGYQSACPPAKK